MDVVDAIARVQTYDPPGTGLENVPVEPIVIESVMVIGSAPGLP